MKNGTLGLISIGMMTLSMHISFYPMKADEQSINSVESTPRINNRCRLPSDLLFIKNGQIWKLSKTGETVKKLTSEATPIESFDASRKGDLIYVSENSLILATESGTERKIIVKGAELVVSDIILDNYNNPDYLSGKISSPIWSSDGNKVFYIQNGLKSIRIDDRAIETIHANDSLKSSDPRSSPLVFQSIKSISPDDRYLVVSVFHLPLKSMYHINLALKTAGGYLSALPQSLDADTAWSDDGGILIVADPSTGGQNSLSRCNSENSGCVMIGQEVPARSACFYKSPHLSSNGLILVFIGSGDSPVSYPDVYKLHEMKPDGYEIRKIRSESFQIREALWCKDDSGVLIVSSVEMSGLPAGTLWWIPAGSGPIISLPAQDCHSFRWSRSLD